MTGVCAVGDQDWDDGERTHRLRFRAFGLLGALLAITSTIGLAIGAATPANAAVMPMRALHGNNAPVPPGATRIGPAPDTDTLPLTVTLQPRNPAALALEVQAVSSPTSPEYRDFLMPAQFASRFGATPATIAAVTSALRNEGLTVGPPTAGGLSIPVSGTVAQEEAAFSTPITKYKLSSGKTGYHNDAEPKVPATVAPQIEGVLGLDTLTPPKPQTTTIPQAATGVSPSPSSAVTPSTSLGQPSPTGSQCTVTANNSVSFDMSNGGLDAPELAKAYSFGSLYTANDYGAGTTIALLEMQDAGYSSTDISTFAACYGITLGGSQITEKSVSSGADVIGGATIEAELDIETALSLAPQANIDVYEAGNSDSIYSVFSKIVNDDLAKIVSASWTNGCEAYQPASSLSSENTLFQQAALEGQSVFVASGDQGSEGCNINGQVSATTGSTPVAQAVDPSTGTLYIANQGSATVSVDSEGDGGNSTLATSVSVGSSPDAVALDSTDKRVFVANKSSNSLSEFSSNTCNDTTTSGCGTTTDTSGISSPRALAMSGTTLYVGNGNGTVAVYNASSNTLAGSVTLPSGTVPTAVAVDATNGFVYVADGTNNRVAYFSSANCNAGSTSGCSTTPSTTTVKTDPVALAVDGSAGNLYVANGGGTGGISVISLSTHAVTTTISTGSPSVSGIDGDGVVNSIGLSPDGNEVLAVLHNLTFPGDVLATISSSTNAITATADLQTGNDTMGQLVSDGASSRDYVWVTDESGGSDILQNLSLAVSDPASQPYLTAVGGTSLPSGSLGPPPTESTWNDQLNFAEGAGGGGISDTFAMPSYQQSYGGIVSGSSGTPCGNSGGYCREVPDVSADADPNTGYIVYEDQPSQGVTGWVQVGGTSGAAPLWAAVTAVAASSKNVTVGFGDVNPDLYYLAQTSPGTYLNDVTAGNNDFNAANGGSYTAMTGYDMATGLGTPITSALAGGLTTILVAVSGTQTYGGSPSFTPTPNFLPSGITLSGSLSCTKVGSSTSINSTLSVGSYTLLQSSCSGVTLSGTNASNYSVAYTSAANDFTVKAAPVNVAVSGSQTYGGSPTFNGTDTPPSGITVNTAALTCTTLDVATTIAPTVAAGTYTLIPNSCSNATLSGTNSSDYTVNYTAAPNDFTVNQAPLMITASSGTMTYGGTVPTITASYSPFVNGQTHANLTTQPTCTTMATSSSPVLGSPFGTSCGGAVDPNYAISYTGGTVTVSPAPLTITASSPSMQYGSTPPTITPQYSGFISGDGASSLNPQPTCSTTATNTSPVSPPTYPSSCSGAADSNYTISYVAGAVTVTKAPIDIAVSGFQTYGSSTPTFSGNAGTPPSGVTVNTATVTCTTVGSSTIITSALTVASGPYTLLATSCSGAALGGANASNYTIVYTSANNDFVVNPDPLTVTASSGTMTYGGTVPAITAGYSTFANGQNQSAFTTQPTCTTTATNSSPVSGSPYVSSCGGAVDPNYIFTYLPGTVTISPAPLTITASSPSMQYGSTPPTITPQYSGFISGDGASSLNPQPTCSTTATHTSPVSPPTYPSSCSGAADSNYTISYVAGAVTVTKAPIDIAVSGSQTYGSSTPIFSGADTPPTGVTVTTTNFTCTTVGTSTPIGPTLTVTSSPYTLLASSCSGATLSGTNSSNYTIVYTSANNDFAVGPAPLTVTASSGTMTYGGTVSTITAGYSTFANGQNQTAFTTQPTCTTTATNTSTVAGSPYASTCSGAVDPNYNFTYVSGQVTVTAATIDVVVSGSQSFGGSPTFNGSDSPPSGVTVTTTAVTCTTVQPSTTISTSLAVGSYTLVATTCTGATLSGPNSSNYAIAYTSAANDFTVLGSPIPVSVSGSQTYGSSAPAFLGSDSAPSGVTVNTTGLTCTTVGSTTLITHTLPAGSYTLLAGSTCTGVTLSGPNAPDYSVQYTSTVNDFTVTPAPLTITASSPSMMYGGTPPSITAVYSGFVNNDSASSLSTQPTCSTLATSSSPVGGYASTCNGAADPNYAISYGAGSVTVTPAPLQITALSVGVAYGSAVPTITPVPTGFVNGDTLASLTTQPTCSTDYNGPPSPSPVSGSPYQANCSGAADANYTITYLSGQVGVSPALLDVTVSGSQTYGSSTPTFGGSDSPPSGVTVNTAGVSCTTVNPTTSIAPALAVAAYTISGGSTCSGASLGGTNAPNYEVVYVGATNGFTVGPAPLMITASNGTMMYGGTPPTITAGYMGWVNGQNSSALTTQPTCNAGATSSSPVGGYSSTCSGAIDPNYTIGYTPGTVTVSKYPLIITASSGNFEQGGTPPAISPLYSTFPSGKGPSSLTTQPACSTTATSSSGVGSYSSTCSGASSGNYNISYVAGQVSVSPDPPPPPPPPPPDPSHGYWLVGSDGGIFTFGSANFYGSTGNIRLQRPVVGITPTQNKAGYWLVASDGGIFAFGNAGFYGSIPGQGLHPAGSGLQPSLNAPIVAMVPSADGGGYFMVASDGGVFAFGDARFSGSCPGIGGCSGAAVAVVPDASGNGYWLVTQTGHVYAFGDAPAYGAPGPQAAAVTSAVRTSDGNGYYILLADGTVYAYGDAVGRGSPSGVGGLDPASAIFTDSGGGGYWVATSMGAVYTFGDAPNDGSMAGTALNGSIIAATGF